jgi:hypothetical protein
VTLKRLKDGEINVRLLPPKQLETNEESRDAEGKRSEKQWLIVLKKIVADQYAVEFEDLIPSKKVFLIAEQIKLSGDNVSTAKGNKGTASLSLTLNKIGSIHTNGSFGIYPLAADVKLEFKDLAIVPLQNYFSDKINLIITEGSLSTKGVLSLMYSKDEGVKTTYSGEASVTKFSSVDKKNADDFLKWDSLYLNGIDFRYKPLYVNINEVALADFYSRLIIYPDATLNVQRIIKSGKEDEDGSISTREKIAVEQKAESSSPLNVAKVTLQEGTINFSDRYIRPSYSVNLSEIGGRISGLSSKEDILADVDLKGKLNNYAPLEITGKVNPLGKDLYVDLDVDFKDMDLSPITPYSGKYIGYTIQKGKLSLNLKYLIVKKKLDSQNKVFLDQLTLGGKVDSPDATKLPVKLAIALLKDRKGEIKLDLPVTGHIDDPEFSLGSIIIKMIINILVKAATSPFALLGAIIGGGEELSFLEFDYGSFDLNDEGKKKLSTLVKALSDRPSLKLEIEGYVDSEKDREALRQYLFNKKIKAQKLKDMVKKGQSAVPVDEVKIEQNEYPKYLKKAYKKEKFPKPRNFIGLQKKLPVPEMEKLMLTHIKVTDDDLRKLAHDRALKVKDYILASKQIEKKRLFLVEPKSLQPGKKENLKTNRVNFKLK